MKLNAMELLSCLLLLLTGPGALAAAPPAVDAVLSAAIPTPSNQPIACWAVPSNNDRYLGHYVGGGCAAFFRAEPRRPHEGTWGWDYQGWFIPRRVNLG